MTIARVKRLYTIVFKYNLAGESIVSAKEATPFAYTVLVVWVRDMLRHYGSVYLVYILPIILLHAPFLFLCIHVHIKCIPGEFGKVSMEPMETDEYKCGM